MTAVDVLDGRVGDDLRERVRAAVGIGAEASPDVRRTGEVPVRHVVLGMAAVTGIPAAMVALLGLPLASGLGRSADLVTHMAGSLALGTGAGAMLAPALGRSLAPDTTRFGRLAVVGTGIVGAGIAMAGLLSPGGGMLVAGLGCGVTAVATAAVLARGREVQDRVRGIAGLEAARNAGILLATLLVAGIAYGTEVPVAVMVLGLLALVLLGLASGADLASIRMPDRDLARIRAEVAPDLAEDDEAPAEPFRRVWAVPTVRRLGGAQAAIGVAFVALHVHLVRFLTLDAGLGLWGRGAVYGAVALAALAVVRLSSTRDEARLRDDPARLVTAASSALAASGVALWGAVLLPWYSRVLLLVVAFSLVAAAKVQCDALLVATVRPRLRPHASAVGVGLTMLLGAGPAAPLLATVARRADAGGALVATAIVLLLAARATRRVHAVVGADVDAALTDEIESAQVAVLRASDASMPLLAATGVNFSYGSVQVLFDVDLRVEDGQMVGLLGTNGAGKSTLLRVLSGLGTPTSGTIRHRGEDITYLDPAARVLRGITQVPGGKAVFGSLSVADNLRVHAHTLGRDRRAVDEGIERAFATFPRLAERRDVPSRVLSGGERQMLALSKALVLRPRVLLIDELSLGLAPVVVGQLLEMVREINRSGTAIVLVEQSVNVALSLVDHAYYMEKGEMRFDGSARGLLDRPDLLRSVYLQGAAEGLA